MTASLPNTRLLAILGALVALVGLLLVARPMFMGSSDESTSAPAIPKTAPATTPPPSAARAGTNLVPGLPAALAQKLRYKNVVVVSLYAAKAPGDRKALAHARVGARKVGAGFLAVNLYDERKANSVVKFVGTSDSPAILVVRRPGIVVTHIGGFVDAEIVAQAAQNAGAHKSKKSAKSSSNSASSTS
jgi:hypothetical protein